MQQGITFSKQEEKKVSSTATWGTIVAISSIVSSAIGMFAAARAGAIAMVFQLGVLFVSSLLAVWLYQASAAFHMAVTADGVTDQGYLMEGFRKLKAYFMTSGVLFIIGLCLAGLVTLLAIVGKLL